MGLRNEIRGPVLVVTLDSPGTRNALDMATLKALGELMDSVAYREPLPPDPRLPGGRFDIGEGGGFRPHAVVLRATGPVFCAGADLKEMKQLGEADFQANLDAALEMGKVFRAVRSCPAPVIARVQGPAYGGGVGLVAACDVAVAAPESRFMFSEARLGLVPGVISPLIVDRMGPAAARRCFLTAEPLSAADALRLGLVDRLAEPGGLDAAVEQTVRAVLECGPAALSLCKSLVDGVVSLGYDRSAEFAARLIAEARTGREGQAALKAFAAREKAPWVTTEAWSLPAEQTEEDQ